MAKRHVKPNDGDVKREPRISTFRQRDVWIEQLLAAKRLSDGAKLVAVRIALHLNINSGRCCPSIVKLAQGTGLVERHIPRVLALLERSDWLDIEHGSRGRGRANSFRLTTPEILTRESVFGTKENLTPETRKPDSGVSRTAMNSERGRGGAPRPLTRAGGGR